MAAVAVLNERLSKHGGHASVWGFTNTESMPIIAVQIPDDEERKIACEEIYAVWRGEFNL